MAAQRGLFDPDERYAALSKAGDPLERLEGLSTSSSSGQSWMRRSIVPMAGKAGARRWTRSSCSRCR